MLDFGSVFRICNIGDGDVTLSAVGQNAGQGRQMLMSSDQDVNSSAYLTDSERDALISRMKVAWNALPPEKQAALKPMLDNAHQQLANYLSTGAPPEEHARPLLHMKSYLTDDWDKHLDALGVPSARAKSYLRKPSRSKWDREVKYSAQVSIRNSTSDGRWLRVQSGLRTYYTDIRFPLEVQKSS
jgi:hypothetical protein